MGNVYLGKRVKDIRKKGLDTIKELRGICRAIINDYKKGRISYRTACSRFALLTNIVIKRCKIKNKRLAKKIARSYWEKLMSMRKKGKKSKRRKKK